MGFIPMTISTNINMLLKWVPGHKDIPGNEMADKYAKEAATIPPSNSCEGVEEKKTVSYDAARAYIKRQLKDGPIKHARTATVYKHLNRKRDSVAVKSRKDGALLAQLRSGHCLKLQEYRNRIGLEDSPTCPTCGEQDQDVGHWLLRCPGTLPARQSLFDNIRCMSLGTLCKNPKKILELAKITLGLRSD